MHGTLSQHRRGVPILSATLLALLAAAPGHTQSYADPADGKRLAMRWCGDCHQVELRLRATASDAVPSFQAVADMPSTTVLSIHAFLRTPHTAMPDYRLTEPQIDNISAYILGLRAHPSK